ncbi:MAG TPA: cell wall hydrolase [Sphingomicrobium sp.]|nr:cell wall hydrolase [Sphingomicrobium sp.]
MTSIALPFSPAELFRNLPREALFGGLVALASAAALAGVSYSPGGIGNSTKLDALVQPADRPPAPVPLLIRNLAPETALKVNAGIPLAGGPNPAAQPFVTGKVGNDTRARALECLTSAIYYEAAQESTEGQRGVAQVVLNRVRHPAFPNSVCGVVYEGSTRATGCQFTFTCDGSMSRAPIPSLWNRARKVAEAALNGSVYAPVGYATHYHANYVVPYWASGLVKTTVEGAHIFYRWSGGWGQPVAFSDRWSAREGNPAALRLAALTAPRPVAQVQTAKATVEKLEAAGAKVIEGKDGRVRLLFTPQAREAVEKMKVTPYVERVTASNNLRFALQGGTSGEPERPFGRSPEATTQPTQ